MKIVSMDELETLYGRHDGAPLSLDDMGISRAIVNDIMLHEVADLVEEILEKHINEDIYAAYSPRITYYGKHPPVGWVSVGGEGGRYIYRRRWSLYENIIREIMGDTLFVTSDASPNESVMGSGWTYNKGGFIQMLGTNPGSAWHGRFARPALQNTQAEIESNGYIQRAIAEAFSRGLKRYK